MESSRGRARRPAHAEAAGSAREIDAARPKNLGPCYESGVKKVASVRPC